MTECTWRSTWCGAHNSPCHWKQLKGGEKHIPLMSDKKIKNKYTTSNKHPFLGHVTMTTAVSHIAGSGCCHLRRCGECLPGLFSQRAACCRRDESAHNPSEPGAHSLPNNFLPKLMPLNLLWIRAVFARKVDRGQRSCSFRPQNERGTETQDRHNVSRLYCNLISCVRACVRACYFSLCRSHSEHIHLYFLRRGWTWMLQGHFSMERHSTQGRGTDSRIKAKLSIMSPDNHIKPISVYTLRCTKFLCLVEGRGERRERKRGRGKGREGACERETERLSGVCSCLNALRLLQNTKCSCLKLGQWHTNRKDSHHLRAAVGRLSLAMTLCMLI